MSVAFTFGAALPGARLGPAKRSPSDVPSSPKFVGTLSPYAVAKDERPGLALYADESLPPK
jgi:hypothetical protein